MPSGNSNSSKLPSYSVSGGPIIIISQLNIERLKYLERADIIVENNKNINETIKIINEAIIK